VRWLTLYARSRQMPMVFGLVLVAALGAWGLSRLWSEAGSVLAALGLAAGAAIAGASLGGSDFALERTASIAWLPRRAVHALGVAVVVGGLLLAVQTLGEPLSGNGFIIRDSLGLAGLAALGATVAGAQYSWAPPITWFAVTTVVPPGSDTGTQVLTWLVQPAGTTAATVTAATLAVLGIGAYAVVGPRR
jgi:hypothetical protein